MGDANASIPTTQPVICRPMFGARAGAAGMSSLVFVSASSLTTVKASYGLRKRIEAVRGCRAVRKKDMKLNSYLPRMRVDPETYEVKADGVKCDSAVADRLPLAQGSYVF
ncbi:MAG: urease, alpha subunit [Olpidium bornovanus]|uniref:Urease, alpha subunit n=1 Tax=Olpidium bornovanus TaxID=278681 RepID=A0A8H8A1M4_9FUNG|nr:MAG: urease, alpha subunit [Olpidium bornovanus]